MARWFLIPIILFVTLNPVMGLSNILENIISSIANIFVTTIGAVDFIAQALDYSSLEVRDRTPKNQQEYDFIIVGAGSAGATIASRLSEINNWKILLIEAGGHESLIYDVPLAALILQLDDAINWGYLTEPSNNYCLGMKNKQCRFSQGKGLGGTSIINFMIATRGNKKDYDEWAELTGDENWSYKGMLPIFKKIETFHNDLVDYRNEYHNFKGPVHITNPPYRTPLATAFVNAGKEMGFSSIDYNGPKQTGFSYMQSNMINGERMSSNRAYLRPVRNRKNLFVTINSRVNKVLIEPKTKKAYGVEFTKNGKTIQVIAKKEVILSAGSIATPKILMLSGVGPADHLQSLGIQVLQNAPVGENLIDHVGYGGLFFLINKTVGIVPSEYINPTNPSIPNYLSERTGPLATSGGMEGIGFVNVDNLRDKTDSPNLELLFGTSTMVCNSLVHLSFGITGKYWTDYFAPKLNHHAYQIVPILFKPKSRGRITLRSTKPSDKPKIIPNYFTHPEDIRILIKGIRLAIEVSKTKVMQHYDSQLNDQVVPGCENHVIDSDAYWECALRTYSVTLWHYSGTCKMGKDNDPTAVVNTKLQVRGIQNLRVADASIMPNIVRGHLNIPSIAIGEKFAEILKHDYGYK